MTRENGMCAFCGCDFPLEITHITYAGLLYCSKDCIVEMALEDKDTPEGVREVENNYEVRLAEEPKACPVDEVDGPEDHTSSSEVSTESRRAGFRAEAEFECFDTDQYLWLDATPIADSDEVKFRSERCPECGNIHWTGIAL